MRNKLYDTIAETIIDFIAVILLQIMNSMKLVIPLHLLYLSIHTKDENKRVTQRTQRETVKQNTNT